LSAVCGADAGAADVLRVAEPADEVARGRVFQVQAGQHIAVAAAVGGAAGILLERAAAQLGIGDRSDPRGPARALLGR